MVFNFLEVQIWDFISRKKIIIILESPKRKFILINILVNLLRDII